jgi:hypothetical protein
MRNLGALDQALPASPHSADQHTIHGQCDSSPDGASWELHFELTYTKLSSAVVGRIDA